MAFSLRHLAPLGNQSRRGVAPQEFVYRTTDSLATVAAADYFNDIAAQSKVGDIIHIQVVDDVDAPTTVTTEASYTIATNTGTAVTVSSISNKVYLTTTITDVSTASSAWVVSPVAGNITKVYSVLYGAITGADAVVTTRIGGAPVTNGSLTIAQAGSAAGDVDVATPTAARTVTAGTAIQFETNGASTNAEPLTITVEITM